MPQYQKKDEIYKILAEAVPILKDLGSPEPEKALQKFYNAEFTSIGIDLEKIYYRQKEPKTQIPNFELITKAWIIDKLAEQGYATKTAESVFLAHEKDFGKRIKRSGIICYNAAIAETALNKILAERE